MLYALETTHSDRVSEAADGVELLTGPAPGVITEAHALVHEILGHRSELDRMAEAAADNWRLERIASIERNILRLGIHELMLGEVPAKVVIDESLWLTHRFAGPKAPAFINGVLDRVARDLGRL